LQGSNLFIECTQLDWGYFQIVADFVGLKPQKFFFCQNAWQHSVTMQLYGVFCILGLGLYGPQLWTGVCIVAYSGAVRIPRTPVCAMSLQGCRLLIHAFGGMGPFSNCGRCCRVNAPEVFVLSKCLAAFSEYAVIYKSYWGVCILGLGLYVPQLWTGVCIVAYSGAVRIPQTPVCAVSLQGSRLLIHAFSGTGAISNCGRCCRVKTPEVFTLVKVMDNIQ